MKIKEKAIVTISRNKKTGDRSWCDELLKVEAVNKSHALLSPVDKKSYWYGKPRIFLFDEYDFSLANNFVMKDKPKPKRMVKKKHVVFYNIFECGGDIRITTYDSEIDAIDAADKNNCKYYKIAHKIEIPYICEK